jgi:hypothetical protein
MCVDTGECSQAARHRYAAQGLENTHEEGECLLELGDLLLGKRVSLWYAVSTLSRVLPAGWRCVDFQGGV